MNPLKDKKGLSRIECISITGICIILICFAVAGGIYYKNTTEKGNDIVTVENAKDAAQLCFLTENMAEGYFDKVSGKIVSKCPSGYNEFPTMTIGNDTYKGKRGTMVVKVMVVNDVVKLSWVEGEN